MIGRHQPACPGRAGRPGRRALAALALAGVAAILVSVSAGCQSTGTPKAYTPKIKPAKVEAVGDTGVKRVTLTADAAKRISVQTAPIRQATIAGQPRKVLPYAAVVYDRKGLPWTITNPAPLTYLREKIVVHYIDGDTAVLADGPPLGTVVVTVGAPEIYGAELGIG